MDLLDAITETIELLERNYDDGELEPDCPEEFEPALYDLLHFWKSYRGTLRLSPRATAPCRGCGRDARQPRRGTSSRGGDSSAAR